MQAQYITMQSRISDQRTHWVRRFADRLARLQPGMDPTVYEQVAAWSYPDAADVPPEQAAALYVVDRPVRTSLLRGGAWTRPSGA